MQRRMRRLTQEHVTYAHTLYVQDCFHSLDSQMCHGVCTSNWWKDYKGKPIELNGDAYGTEWTRWAPTQEPMEIRSSIEILQYGEEPPSWGWNHESTFNWPVQAPPPNSLQRDRSPIKKDREE